MIFKKWGMVDPEMMMIGTSDAVKTLLVDNLSDFYKTIQENKPDFVFDTWEEI